MKSSPGGSVITACDSGLPPQVRGAALQASVGAGGLELTTPLFLPKIVLKETLFPHVSGSAGLTSYNHHSPPC